MDVLYHYCQTLVIVYCMFVGIVLGSFFYGYITTQLIGGWLSQRFGGKHVFGYGVLCTAVLSMFSPVVVDASVWLLVTLRIFEGVGEVSFLKE